ncbi:MAG: hypothetical protein IJD70_00645 [Clostridia bacterium]|nr:hypothetical protein [Clostridia bacterium]
MNHHTKKSLIFSILSFAAMAIGVIVFILICDSISDSVSRPIEDESGLATLGKVLAVFAGAIATIIVGIVDSVFTSLFAYVFAYFSHEHAKNAIDACGDDSTTAKALRIISVIEMVIAAIVALFGLLMIFLLFSF